MKKLAAVLFVIIMLLVSVSLSEETVFADTSEGSRLIGLLITREDLAGHTDESGVLLASCLQKGSVDETEYRFGDISGLQLICFIAPSKWMQQSASFRGRMKLSFWTLFCDKMSREEDAYDEWQDRINVLQDLIDAIDSQME